jgi:hypothetical protein
VGFKTHFEVEKVSAVRANRGSRGSLNQPFYILHKTLVSEKSEKSLKISKSKNSPHCPFKTPDITTPIRIIPTRIKNSTKSS